MSEQVDLSIVIVAWNVRDLVLDSLASIEAAQLGLRYEVIVVDNGSVDGTCAAVAAQFPWVRLLPLPAFGDCLHRIAARWLWRWHGSAATSMCTVQMARPAGTRVPPVRNPSRNSRIRKPAVSTLL